MASPLVIPTGALPGPLDTAAQMAIEYINNFEWEQGVTPLTSQRSFYSIHVVYISMLLYLQKYMADRKSPAWLGAVSFVHNCFMSLLSLAMLVGLLYGAFLSDRFSSWDGLTCKHPHKAQGLVPFTMYVFYLSKGLEFIDTFLLILGRKKLIWLHKIHHLTTMGLVYHAMNSNLISDFICGGTNCLVHVIMYAYFAKPMRFLRPLITSSQIAQFLVCLFFLVIPFSRRLLHPEAEQCDGTIYADLHGIAMYGVYLTMFVNFFLQQYIKTAKIARDAKQAVADEKKAAELKKSGGEEKLLINGRVYDVSTFISRHPGGSIIKFGLDTDATAAFMEFHLRSKKAQAMLKALPSVEDDGTFLQKIKDDKREKREAITKDLVDLHRQLEKEGWFKPDLFHVTYRITELFALFALGFYLALGPGYLIPAAAVLGIASGRCGWLMHEGGHNSLTGVIPVDQALQCIIYGVGCGMSARYWRNQHNKHHATPQKLGHDTDLETLPLVAFNSEIANRLPKNHIVRRLWLPMQGVLFAPLTCLIVTLGWQGYQHPRHSIRVGAYAELLCYLVRYVGWYHLFSYFGWTPAEMIGFYVAMQFFGGSYIFVNFAVSHTHLDVVDAKDKATTWAEYASDYTINCTNNIFVNWWMAYLNFQIEHHLFPAMPQYRFATLSPRIQKFMAQHGLKYDCRGYFAALKDTFVNLHTVANA